jgi:hypothetical protein
MDHRTGDPGQRGNRLRAHPDVEEPIGMAVRRRPSAPADPSGEGIVTKARHVVTDACDLAVSGSGRGPISHWCWRVTVHWSSRRDPETKMMAA